MRKWKARIVAGGHDIRDWWGSKAESDDLYTLPVGIGPLRCVASISVLEPDFEAIQIDFDGAYLQTPRPVGEMWARLPTIFQDSRMKAMAQEGRDPVVPLHKRLYGEPDAGDHWDLYLVKRMVDQGWQKVRQTTTGSLYKRGRAFCAMYVDDGATVGPLQMLLQYLFELKDVLDIGTMERLHHLLGIRFVRLAVKGSRMMLVHQMDYAEMLVLKFESDNGGPVRNADTPWMTIDASMFLVRPGKFEKVARKHLGGLSFLVRC